MQGQLSLVCTKAKCWPRALETNIGASSLKENSMARILLCSCREAHSWDWRHCGTVWNGLKCSFFWTVLLFVSVSCCTSCPNNQYIFWGRVSLLYPKIASNLPYSGGWLQSSDPPNLTSWMTALQACTITTCLWSAEESNGSFVLARETLYLLNYTARPNSQVFTLLYPLLCSKCLSSSHKSCMQVF